MFNVIKQILKSGTYCMYFSNFNNEYNSKILSIIFDTVLYE